MKIQDRAVHQIASYSNQILETAQISTNSRTVATEFYPVTDPHKVAWELTS